MREIQGLTNPTILGGRGPWIFLYILCISFLIESISCVPFALKTINLLSFLFQLYSLMLMILQYIGRNSIIFPHGTLSKTLPPHTRSWKLRPMLVLLERFLNYFSLSLYASDKQLTEAGEFYVFLLDRWIYLDSKKYVFLQY